MRIVEYGLKFFFSQELRLQVTHGWLSCLSVFKVLSFIFYRIADALLRLKFLCIYRRLIVGWQWLIRDYWVLLVTRFIERSMSPFCVYKMGSMCLRPSPHRFRCRKFNYGFIMRLHNFIFQVSNIIDTPLKGLLTSGQITVRFKRLWALGVVFSSLL